MVRNIYVLLHIVKYNQKKKWRLALNILLYTILHVMTWNIWIRNLITCFYCWYHNTFLEDYFSCHSIYAYANVHSNSFIYARKKRNTKHESIERKHRDTRRRWQRPHTKFKSILIQCAIHCFYVYILIPLSLCLW